MQNVRHRVMLLVGFLTLSSGVFAQTRPSTPALTAPAVSSSEPQQTTAVFGDWTLRCVRLDQAAQAKQTCEIVQSLQTQVQGQNQPFAQLAVGRVEASQPMRFVALMPVNVVFPSSVKIAVDESDAQPLELVWRRCLPTVCVADTEFNQAAMGRLRARNEGGRMTFRDGAGRDLSVVISLRGFSSALDALMKQAN